jgi:hypothetical protein
VLLNYPYDTAWVSECIELQGSVNMTKQIDVDFGASQNLIINFLCVYVFTFIREYLFLPVSQVESITELIKYE